MAAPEHIQAFALRALARGCTVYYLLPHDEFAGGIQISHDEREGFGEQGWSFSCGAEWPFDADLQEMFDGTFAQRPAAGTYVTLTDEQADELAALSEDEARARFDMLVKEQN